MSLVKTILDDVRYEGRSVEEHSLVGIVVVGLGNFLSTVDVTLPHLRIHNPLNLSKEHSTIIHVS